MEISEISYSRVLSGNLTQRFDSEYFKKIYLSYKKDIEKQKYYYFESNELGAGKVSGGKRLPLDEEFSDTGISYIRAQDIKNGFVNNNNSPKISEAIHEKLKRYQTKDGDVLITIVGNSIGDVGFVKKNKDKWNLTENAVRVVSEKLLSEYIFSFLLSKYGQAQIIRETVGTAQPKLAIERIRNFEIPSLSEDFQFKVKNLVQLSYVNKEKNSLVYQQVEKILLENIGLKNFTFSPFQEKGNIKSFKNSFLETGRLDAEYYQPKYEEYINLVEKYNGGFEELREVCNFKGNNFVPEENEEYRYIELADIGNSGDITGYTLAQGKELPTRARRKVVKGDVIVSSIEGSLESCALVGKDYDKALCSTGFYVINSDKINSETLLVLFKSEVMQNILKQRCSGTILTAINKEEFLTVPIPLIDSETQQSISEKVQESFLLRKQSEHLLEVAKRAVEIAIESSEAEAIVYINKEVRGYV